MMQDFNDIERMVAKIIVHGNIYARRDLICALIKNEKIRILEQLRDKWGEEEWEKLVETC